LCQVKLITLLETILSEIEIKEELESFFLEKKNSEHVFKVSAGFFSGYCFLYMYYILTIF
jgi:hypothetical protein